MDKKSTSRMVISSLFSSFASILGPLLILGLPAFFLDKYFQTAPLIFLSAVITAFIITNILLFKKVAQVKRSFAQDFSAPAVPDKKNR